MYKTTIYYIYNFLINYSNYNTDRFYTFVYWQPFLKFWNRCKIFPRCSKNVPVLPTQILCQKLLLLVKKVALKKCHKQ